MAGTQGSPACSQARFLTGRHPGFPRQAHENDLWRAIGSRSERGGAAGLERLASDRGPSLKAVGNVEDRGRRNGGWLQLGAQIWIPDRPGAASAAATAWRSGPAGPPSGAAPMRQQRGDLAWPGPTRKTRSGARSLPVKVVRLSPRKLSGSLSKRPEESHGCRCAADLCPATARWDPMRRASCLTPADRLCRTLR